MIDSTLVLDVAAPAPLTVRALLAGNGSVSETIEQTIGDDDIARAALRPVRRLTRSAVAGIDHEVAAMAEELLDLDLGDLLIAGWRKYTELTDAARRTLAVPGSRELVSLAAHRMRSTYAPRVDLVVNGATLHSFEFELVVVFEVTGLEAVVRAGTLLRLNSGRCVVEATLSLDSLRLAEQRRAVDLEFLVRLNPPLPLI
ncbi:hypothetical protein OHA70_33410 [Kribbella sp. NBC_00382]|uniref:hypothetical protein n=1 Tax=Kribbella sp. NBC_00382 TaxID=2975967 RepID=UPI002E1F2AF0